MLISRDRSTQASLDQVEQELLQVIESRAEKAVDFLEEVVNVNSGSLHFDGVREVGDLFGRELSELGFDISWIDGQAFGRAGHLMARRGNSGPHFLLIGHLDTVFEKDDPFQKFTRTSDSTATGPGVIDMKGGDVVMVEAIRALRTQGILDDMTVTVVLIGDEESSGDPLELGRAALEEAARVADIAVAFEPGDGDPATAVIARRGFAGWEVHIQAEPAHSSTVFDEETGYGAIYEAARILTRFREALEGERWLTFNPGLMLGGTTLTHDPVGEKGTAFGKTNIIAERALIAGDLRTVSFEQREEVKERMREVVENSLRGTSSEIHFRDSYPPMSIAEGNQQLLSLLDKVSKDIGYGPVTALDPAEAGAADISFAAAHVSMAIDGLGLMGGETHTDEEWVDLTTLPMQTGRTAVLMYRIARDWTP